MRTLSHSQDDQAWEIFVALAAAKPDASPAFLVRKAYEAAAEFEKFRQERQTETRHHAEPSQLDA